MFVPVLVLAALHLSAPVLPAQPDATHVTAVAPPRPKLAPKPAPPAVPVAFSRVQANGLYDSTEPGAIPRGKVQALYINGRFAGDKANEKHHERTLWIDITGYDYKADILDVEQGDATPEQAGPWAERAFEDHGKTRPVIVYSDVSNWHPVLISMAEYAPNVPVKMWIASPQFGYPHAAPGACAVQWYWGATYNVSETWPCLWTPG